jgi:Uncharacterized protein conserved in bacteria (DUF2272)
VSSQHKTVWAWCRSPGDGASRWPERNAGLLPAVDAATVTQRFLALSFVFSVAAALGAAGQGPSVERLARRDLDVSPPGARVSGLPGQMTVRPAPCRSSPVEGIRRRIVDVAVQEWAYFGFTVVDQTEEEDDQPAPGARRGRRRGLPPEQAARVASSIAGYWAVTPEASWIVGQQNEAWNGPDGVGARWRYPWSAAFISWVMCESGLSDTSRFRRAIGHYSYIDQAIRARDSGASGPAYAAYDAGQVAVAPGDLLCTARRPAYQSLAERRRQLDQGARTHCDVIVHVDEAAGRYFAIGGNVRGAVSLKVIPAVTDRGRLRPANRNEGGRTFFAHLSLRAPAIGLNAFASSPTMRAVGCGGLTARVPTMIAGTMRASLGCAPPQAG